MNLKPFHKSVTLGAAEDLRFQRVPHSSRHFGLSEVTHHARPILHKTVILGEARSAKSNGPAASPILHKTVILSGARSAESNGPAVSPVLHNSVILSEAKDLRFLPATNVRS